MNEVILSGLGILLALCGMTVLIFRRVSPIIVGPLAALLGPCPTVTSSHHQAVDRVGEGLLPCQWAPDGAVEALYAPNRPVLGVQWHPERQSFAYRRRDADDGAPVFRWLGDTLTNGGPTLYNEN